MDDYDIKTRLILKKLDDVEGERYRTDPFFRSSVECLIRDYDPLILIKQLLDVIHSKSMLIETLNETK